MITRATLMTALSSVAVTTAIALTLVPAASAQAPDPQGGSSDTGGWCATTNVSCRWTKDKNIQIRGNIDETNLQRWTSVSPNWYVTHMDSHLAAQNRYKLVCYDNTDTVVESRGDFIPDGNGGGSDRWVLVVLTPNDPTKPIPYWNAGWLNAVSLAPGW